MVDELCAGLAYDLVLLALRLPKRDSVGACKTPRDRRVKAPGLLLTVRDQVADKVTALDLGANDDLTPDPATREVRRGTRRLELTTREYALLEYFMPNPGRGLTRPKIVAHVWGIAFDSEKNIIIDVHGGGVRRKIDATGEGPPLHTVRGAGAVMKGDG